MSKLSNPIISDDGFHHLVYSISGTTHTIFVDNNKTLGILKDRITTQYDGVSFLDKENKIFRKK